MANSYLGFLWEKLPLRLLATWCFFVSFLYLYIIKSPADLSLAHITIQASDMVNGVVLIAMDAMATDPMVDYTIEAVRNVGHWSTNIYIITDSPDCFHDIQLKHGVQVVSAPTVTSLVEIKAMKTRIFEFLPTSIDGVLYLDVDILVKQDLKHFFKSISDYIVKNRIQIKPVPSNSSISNLKYLPFDMGAFPDAKGHYVGFCSGCEKWHTGVLFMRRQFGETCLAAWRRILLSGQYDTDQESLDEAERLGECPHLLMLPKKHLLFAKDYIGWVLTSGHSFVHVTGAGRLEQQDYFYREWVIPSLRKSLGSAVDYSLITNGPKTCNASHALADAKKAALAAQQAATSTPIGQ